MSEDRGQPLWRRVVAPKGAAWWGHLLFWGGFLMWAYAVMTKTFVFVLIGAPLWLIGAQVRRSGREAPRHPTDSR